MEGALDPKSPYSSSSARRDGWFNKLLPKKGEFWGGRAEGMKNKNKDSELARRRLIARDCCEYICKIVLCIQQAPESAMTRRNSS